MAASVIPVAFGDLEHELASTRRVLERVPEAHFDWRPHPKSWPLGHLAAHVAQLPLWMTTMMDRDALDLMTLPSTRELPATTQALLDTFDGHVADLKTVFAGAEDAALGQPWTLSMGAHQILQMPRAAVLRGMGLSHMIHHRAQLGVYLRLLDVPVPALYGPSADERPG